MTSSAENLSARKNKITMTKMTAKRRKKDIAAQKAAGAIVFAAALAAFCAGIPASAILIPPAIAAIFSKEKILDFNIFR